MTAFLDRLKSGLITLLPHHFLSRLMLWATRIQLGWLKNMAIRQFIRLFRVDMDAAVIADYREFKHFNAFFTRALKAEARPVSATPEAIVSPVDGCISEWGAIQKHQIYQAKGQHYTLSKLLASEPLANAFEDGQFATIYLSPRDYHRIHMPVQGTLKQMIHVPGRLFSVNPGSVRTVPALFARNERVICIFDTTLGEMAMILVGAIFVGSMETVWHGVVTPPTQSNVQQWHYSESKPPIVLQKGEEMGRFNMGSTVILLFQKQCMHWLETDFQAGSALKMGQTLGQQINY